MGYRTGQGLKPTNKSKARAKAKPVKPRPKKKNLENTAAKSRKERQTRLSFKRVPHEAAPSTPPRTRRAGGRMEHFTPPPSSKSRVVVTCPPSHVASPLGLMDLSMSC